MMTKRVLVLNHSAAPRGQSGHTRHVELFDRLDERWQYVLIAGDRSLHSRDRVHKTSGKFRVVPTTPYRGNGIDRIVNWISYSLGALFVGVRQRRIDVVYASSPHLLTGLAGFLLARIRRAAFVLEVRDLWPRILADMGRMEPTSIAYRLVRRLELFLYSHADEIVVLAEGASEEIRSDCPKPIPITLVPNGADLALFTSDQSRETMRRRYGMKGLVFVYTGAHGPANGLHLLLDAAERVKEDLPEVSFWLVGDGLQKPILMETARKRELTNVHFRDPVAKEDIPGLLSAADVGLHVLADVPLFSYGVSPSKLFDYMAASLPVVTNCPGEVEAIVKRAAAGVAVGPENLEEAVRIVAGAPSDQLRDWGEAGRAFIEDHRSSAILADRLGEVLDRVVEAKPRRGSSAASSPKPVLMLSQVFWPDPAATGQYLADVADGIVARGGRVRVLTAARGYDNPSVTYARRSYIRGVDVRRLPFSSFGKRNLVIRAAAQLAFSLQCAIWGLATRDLGSVLVTTSPPMGSVAALIIGSFRRVPITYWVMDINPDQAIVSGMVGADSVAARLLNLVDIRLLRRADRVITLDAKMADRLRSKAELDDKLVVIPPWPLVDRNGDSSRAAFAAAHNPDGRFVVMYSGNHSLVHPLATLIDAVDRLAGDPDLRFIFVGGGLGKRLVEDLIVRHPGGGVISLPYQPLEKLGGTLSAADVHVVTMGDDMVGVVHPSKVYGALAAGRPVLYIGPPSHVSDLIEKYGVGWHFRHGEVEPVVELLRELPTWSESDRVDMRARAQAVAYDHFGRDRLRALFVDLAMARR